MYLVLVCLGADTFGLEPNEVIDHSYHIEKHLDPGCSPGSASSYISADISFPQICIEKLSEAAEGQINTVLRQMAGLKKIPTATTVTVDYKVKKYQDFLSVVFHHTHMPCQASHPIDWYAAATFDLESGKEFQAEDIFQGAYKNVFYTKVVDYLEMAYPKNFRDLYVDPDDFLQNFTFDDEHIYIYFDMYQIGSAAFGSTVVAIPLVELHSHMKLIPLRR